MLRQGIGEGLQVIEAPAGYGKTTLVTQFVEAMNLNPEWVSFKGSPLQVREAVVRISNALYRVATGGAARTAAVAGATQPFPCAAAESKTPDLFVLDGLELVTEATDVALLEEAIAAVRGLCEVILVGRRIGLRSVGRAVVSERVQVLGACELAFSADEVEELGQRLGVPMGSEGLLAETAGWPAAVAARLAGSGTDPSQDFAIARVWAAYVQDDVLAGIPEESLRLITMLSLIPEEARDFGPGILGRGRWSRIQAILREWPMLADPRNPSAASVHPSLARLLVERSRMVPSAQIRCVARRGYRDLVARGRGRAALELALEAGLQSETAEALKEQGPYLVLGGLSRLVIRAVGALAGTRWADDAELIALRAQALADIDPGAAFREAQALIRERGVQQISTIPSDPTGIALVAAMTASTFLSEPPDLRSVARRLEALAPTLSAPAHALAVARLAQYVHLSLGRPLQALTVAKSLLRNSQVTRPAYHRHDPTATIYEVIGECYFTLGDVDNAIAHGRTALDRLDAASGDLFIRAHNNISMYHLVAGHRDVAYSHIISALSHRSFPSTIIEICSTITLAECLMANFRHDDAIKELRKIIDTTQEQPQFWRLTALANSQLAVALRQLGHVEHALRYSSISLSYTSRSMSQYDKSSLYTEYGLSLVKAQQLSSAMEVARISRKAALASGSIYALSRALTLLAMVSQHSSHDDLDWRTIPIELRTRTHVHRQHQWIQAILNEYPQYQDTVRSLVLSIDDQYSEDITTVDRVSITDRSSLGDLLATTPPRLCRVLTELCRGLSNADISQQLGLAEHTVENYVSQLLSRFNCRNRTELAMLIASGRADAFKAL